MFISRCVEYLSENNSHTEVEIKNLAKEQWLLNDLKEICPGSLPKNLKNQHKIILNGRFVLQINAVVDIGTGIMILNFLTFHKLIIQVIHLRSITFLFIFFIAQCLIFKISDTLNET